MIRKGLLLIATLSLSLPLLAQSSSLGVLLGTADYLEDGVSLDVSLDVQEIWYAKDLESGTALKFKLGKTELDVEDDDAVLPRGQHDVEYGLILVEYDFDEVFGSTGLFFGPGAYRQTTAEGDETNFGLSGGVTGDFPITRRLGLIVDAAYHWVNFEDDYDFMTLGAGFRFSF